MVELYRPTRSVAVLNLARGAADDLVEQRSGGAGLGARPSSQRVVYPDAGHGGVFQFHEEFVKRALEFL